MLSQDRLEDSRPTKMKQHLKIRLLFLGPEWVKIVLTIFLSFFFGFLYMGFSLSYLDLSQQKLTSFSFGHKIILNIIFYFSSISWLEKINGSTETRVG